MAGEHVAIQLVEGGIGAAAFEPAEVGRIVGIEGAGPGGEIFAQVSSHRRGGFRIPTGPLAISSAAQPSRSAGDDNQPMQILGSNPAVERARIRQHLGTHALPISTGAHRIYTGGQHLDTRSRGGINHVHSTQPLPPTRQRPTNGQEIML